ncbi:prefoldin subunit 6 [Thamnocephalis sphaerospora]|uniref:Prefoldin subunit 6 n=1 Tax=Thamnocephalis sphaerospora TaxID=78915 RepID=A0A4P9XTE8_9FUNG|nr:prefoldin subunit 6 [Thamnocephalis sphaerospora]|eukprot:RKP09445.1 prefoldin subunit 6 [Thamnocephalis sphaerospora]
MSLQAQLEAATTAFQLLQQDLSKAVSSRQQLGSQLAENEVVQKEFGLLKPDATIYKLIGPVLVPQMRAEAVQNVDKRLEYIRKEIERVEKQIKEYQEKQETEKNKIVKLQTAYQQEVEKRKANV